MKHRRENFKFANNLEEVIQISRRRTGKTLCIEKRKEQHNEHMKTHREKRK